MQAFSGLSSPMEQRAPSSAQSENRLLRMLSEADRDLLQPDLELVHLNQNDVCIEVGTPIEHVYFLEGGLGSTIIPDEVHGTAEIGMQGREGLIGVPVILGADRSPHKTFMQVGGPARRIRVEPLRHAMARSESLHELLLLYAQVFQIQTGETAYANLRHSVRERLARWILMSADRLGPNISLTHEFLSYMLGVRRAGVTTTLHILEGERLIKSTRGNILVLDRTGLERIADRSYGVPEAEYERLIGPWR
jgi:CRP-like cAMP-binding protein